MALPDLEPLEREIMDLLAAGNRTSEIAKRLSLGYAAVVEYNTRIKRKLGVQSVTEIAEVLRHEGSRRGQQ